MRSCQFLIFCALLSLINVTNAQTPAPADVHVKLVLADKKNVFRVGEQIRLNMEIIARNRLLVLKSLEAALRDPNIPATTSMVAATTRLKTMLTHGIREKPADGITWFLEAPENPLAAEIREGYIVELAAGLAKRTGSNQTTTAVTILTFLQKDGRTTSNPGLPEVGRILVQQFDTLDFSTKDWLLREHAKLLDDPALLPSLKKILSASDSTSKSTRGTVLRRLMELAPDEARPYVIAEIRDVNSRVDPVILIGLQDESLPELDATLLDQIRSLTSLSQNKDFVYLKFKTHLLVRFATNNIYGDVMELYRRVGKRLPVDSRAGLLAYFARHNEQEAIPLIEQALSDVKPGQAPTLLTQLTALYYSKSIGTLLKKLLETDDVSQASNAAYLIGLHGLPGDEQVLEARLKRWREQWRDRVAEADAQRQGLIERGLVTALITGKSWKLSDTRANELRMSCLTQLCKESNPTH